MIAMSSRPRQASGRWQPFLPTRNRGLDVRRISAVYLKVRGEVFGILCLTTKHRVFAYHEISRGTLDQRWCTRGRFSSGLIGEVIGIPVLDHIVIGDGRYFSFKKGGRL